MANAEIKCSRFFDINTLIKERDNIRNFRYGEQYQRNPKRHGDNMFVIKNKVFYFKFNGSLLPKRPVNADTLGPKVKRRIIQNEALPSANEAKGGDMDVEVVPVRTENLLSVDLKVTSPVPPEVILEPQPSTSRYTRIADEDFAFDPSWKPSVPEPISSPEKIKSNKHIQLPEAAPQKPEPVCTTSNDASGDDIIFMEVVPKQVEVVPVSTENLLSVDLEVISPVPPDVILEPQPSTSRYTRIADEDFAFDPSWKPSVPEPISSPMNIESYEHIQLPEVAPQNFQASSGNIHKYKTCFKRRNDLRMKDAVDSREEDVSVDHPRIKWATSYLRTVHKQDTVQHWTKLKEEFSPHPPENENYSPSLPFPSLVPYPFNQVSISDHFRCPADFFNRTPRNDQLSEYVKKL